MAKAGVSYHVGREPNQKYGETINGLQRQGAVHHQFIKQVDPFRIPGNPASGLLPGVWPAPKATTAMVIIAFKRTTSACVRRMSQRTADPGPSQKDTMNCDSNCYCATLRLAICVIHGTRSGCQIARPIQQQLCNQHRQHRDELRLSRGRLRNARQDLG